MSDARTFTQQDYLLGACLDFEIGMPWQDRFTKTDAWYGRCTEDQVGCPRVDQQQQPAADPDKQQPEQSPKEFAPLDRTTRRRMMQELQDKVLVMFHADPEGFLKNGGSSLNKFLDAAIRLEDQPETKPRKAWQDMTTDELRTALLESLTARCCPACGHVLIDPVKSEGE